MAQSRKHNPHFLAREPDGTVRLRLRFEGEEASLFEEAAGGTAVLTWIYQTLVQAAKKDIREARRREPQIGPPE